MFYKIISSLETEGKLFIPEKFLAGRVIVTMDSVVISAGGIKQNVEVILDTKLHKDEVMLSADTLKALSIPDDIRYQIIFEKNTIRIGPVIGLLMATGEESLTKVRLRRLADYCVIYPEIQGLIVAFSAESIDFKNQLVRGYYYNSVQEGTSMPWKKGVFPLPDSIFQRTNLSEDIRIRLKKETKNRMFNSNYFNKWEFWKMASKFEAFLKCIPETSLLTSIEDIDNMLIRHDAAYLKPINGTLSRGLYKVMYKDGKYVFQGNQGSKLIQKSSKEEADIYIKQIIGSRNYLVQQAINPLRVNDRHVDFRVIMQKDHTLTWNCTGIVSFVGNHGDICTNWGFTTTFENVLNKYFDFSQQQIFKKKQEVIAACKNVCEMLDLRGGNYGDLGFDVIMDENLKVWILEVNKRHYHIVPLWINDIQTYYEIKTKPIKYASALAGFQVY